MQTIGVNLPSVFWEEVYLYGESYFSQPSWRELKVSFKIILTMVWLQCNSQFNSIAGNLTWNLGSGLRHQVIYHHQLLLHPKRVVNVLPSALSQLQLMIFSWLKGIFMKSRCFTPSIQQLCSQWDHKLSLLREDLMYYQKNELYNRGNLLPFDKLEMQAKIYSALEIRCVESIHKWWLIFRISRIQLFIH